MHTFIKIAYDEMCTIFQELLLKNGFASGDAKILADIFTTNSLEGVYTHGVNRFSRFIQYIQKGWIKPNAIPLLINKMGGIEQWDGALAAGPLNALHSTERAMQLALSNGIGCVTLANTNHWLRAGTYGKKAAEAGFIFISWTNTINNMPAWGAIDAKLGNNPFVLAVPNGKDSIVLDMAMSLYSYGAVELTALKNEQLAFPGGFSIDGELTTDPAAIFKSRRLVPIGYWKGAGMALVLDILATILSGGQSTHEISKHADEYSISQVFIAIDISKLANHSTIKPAIQSILDDYADSIPQSAANKIKYPGQKAKAIREENLAKGIPVAEKVWKVIEGMRGEKKS